MTYLLVISVLVLICILRLVYELKKIQKNL